MLAGLFVLTVGIAYADHSMTEWLSRSVIDSMTRWSVYSVVCSHDTMLRRADESPVHAVKRWLPLRPRMYLIIYYLGRVKVRQNPLL